ncbi:MAG: adenylyl-sulfate kinase [Chitinophagaceae bacterium]|jgi:adenylylsulfate kinase|nr:MAG: adenylyl-sulfate kinase [Chitinophagaceae bacterium]
MNAFTILLTGYSGSGKTTIAQALKREFIRRNIPVELLDGDIVRKDLTADLGFSKKDRLSNARRIGFLASLLSKHGVNVIIAMIAPYSDCREIIRHRVSNYREIYVKCPVTVCEKRDVKGLYKKARCGEILHFTGINDPFEEPVCPDVTCETDQESIYTSVARIWGNLDILSDIREASPFSAMYREP